MLNLSDLTIAHNKSKMKDHLENKLSMYLAVQKVCADNTSVWSSLPAYATSFSTFEGKISNIESVRLIQEQDTTGIAVDKSVSKDELVDKAIEVSTSIHAYAVALGNNELLESITFQGANWLEVEIRKSTLNAS